MLLFMLLATHVECHLWDVVAALFVILDQLKKHGAVLSKPCTSKECRGTTAKNMTKTSAAYPSKLRKSAVPVIYFDPRPSDYW